jgi:hypothetical protein
MAMRKSVRRELVKLREIAAHFLEGLTCSLCRKPLIPVETFDVHEPGSGAGVPLTGLVDITEHHKNGNHDDNRKKNREYVHRECHRRHHANRRWTAEGGFFQSKPRVLKGRAA